MAESRYSIKLAAVDAFTSTFKSFEAQSETAKHAINEQTAALRQLNNASKRIDGHQRLQDALKKTATDLERARAAQMQLKREQATARQQVSQLAARYAEADQRVNALARSTNASKADTKAAAAEQRKLARTLEQAERHVNTLDNRQAKATATVRTLEAAQRGQRNELNRSDAALKKAGVDTGKLADEQKRLASATGRANEALAAQRHKLANVQKAQSKVEDNRAKRADLHGRVLESAALGYLAAKPITKAWDLETAMADVGKVVDFATPAEKAALASENLKLASDRLIAPSGMTAVDLAKIEYAAGQSGLVSKAELVPFTRDAAIMGSAFDMDAESAGETMIGWRAGLNLDQKQVIQLADATNHLSNKFNAKPAELSALIKRYGAVGKKSGLSPEQNAALGAAFLNPGTETEIAGTGFKNFLNALVAGKSAPKERQKQWRSLGFDPDDVAREMQTNPQRIIQDVLEAINDEDEYKQPAIITELFGNESYGAIAPLLTNLKEVKRAFQEVGDKSKFAGSMMAEAEGVAGTGRAKWNGFTAQVNRLATVVGNVLIPPLNTVMGILTPVVSGVADLAEKFPGITQALALAGVGLVALKIGALGVRFAGLLTGQAFNKAGVARARLDTRTAQTATAADAAVARLNATLGRVGKSTGADIETGGGKGRKGKGKAARKGGLAGRWAGMPKFARVGTPLLVAGGVLSAADGLSRGDSEAVGSAVGSVGGGMAGAWAGGAAGAAIGSVVPGVGTVIGGGVGALAGGVIGSLAGDWAGSKTGQAYADWQTPGKPALNVSSLDAGALGVAEQIAALPAQQPVPLSIMDTIGEMFGIKRQSPDPATGGGLDANAVKAATGIIDRLPRPADAAQAVASSAHPSQSFVIQSGAIQLHAGSDPKENDRIIETLMQRLRREFYGASDNSLATRLGAGLTDGKS